MLVSDYRQVPAVPPRVCDRLSNQHVIWGRILGVAAAAKRAAYPFPYVQRIPAGVHRRS